MHSNIRNCVEKPTIGEGMNSSARRFVECTPSHSITGMKIAILCFCYEYYVYLIVVIILDICQRSVNNSEEQFYLKIQQEEKFKMKLVVEKMNLVLEKHSIFGAGMMNLILGSLCIVLLQTQIA